MTETLYVKRNEGIDYKYLPNVGNTTPFDEVSYALRCYLGDMVSLLGDITHKVVACAAVGHSEGDRAPMRITGYEM